MIIYEINLQISVGIFDSYFEWLPQHIAEMLSFTGFTKASVLKEIRTHEAETVKLTVQYFIDSLSALDDYLENNYQRMVEESFTKFSKGFSSTRRIFKVLQ